jgi:hypothetical protein
VGILTHADWAPRTSFLGAEASSDPDTVQTRLVRDAFRAPVVIGPRAYLGA